MNRFRCINEACRHEFNDVTISGGAVRCPKCQTEMFRFQYDGETFTPKEFMDLLDTRGRDAARAMKAWIIPGRTLMPRLAVVGATVAYIWTTLSTTVFAEGEHESPK